MRLFILMISFRSELDNQNISDFYVIQPDYLRSVV